MRLYQMELYKLCHKKIFVIWSVAAVCLELFFFWAAQVGSEECVVGGKRYWGYEAVKENRRITDEYRGTLTDAKVQKIVAEYGLPSEVVEGYGGWWDDNYLNEFVTCYLSDGYLRDWDNYKVPTKVYPIGDTQFGELQELIGKPAVLAYTNGWNAFFDTLQAGMIFGNILVILGISVIFAQESQTRMLPIIFTTQEGRGKDICAKIAASFTLTIIVYGAVVLLSIVPSMCIFGLDGGESPLCMVLRESVFLRMENRHSYMPVRSFLWVVLGFSLLAMLLLCAVTLCVSAHYESNFGAVAMAAALWGMPILVRMLFGSFGYFFTSCMPIFLSMPNSVYESVSWGEGEVTVSLVLGLLLVCVWEGYQVYKRRGE